MLGSQEFMTKAKQLVIDYFNKVVKKTDHTSINIDDVYVVWYCSSLGGNHKCLINTNVSDGIYYEITCNSSKGDIYLIPIRNGRMNVMCMKE